MNEQVCSFRKWSNTFVYTMLFILMSAFTYRCRVHVHPPFVEFRKKAPYSELECDLRGCQWFLNRNRPINFVERNWLLLLQSVAILFSASLICKYANFLYQTVMSYDVLPVLYCWKRNINLDKIIAKVPLTSLTACARHLYLASPR